MAVNKFSRRSISVTCTISRNLLRRDGGLPEVQVTSCNNRMRPSKSAALFWQQPQQQTLECVVCLPTGESTQNTTYTLQLGLLKGRSHIQGRQSERSSCCLQK